MKQRRGREARQRSNTATNRPSSAPSPIAIPFPPGLTSLALFSTPRRRKDPLPDVSQSKRRNSRQRVSAGECRFAALMAANLVIATGASALATALDTMPQWGPYLSAWLASLSSTSLRPGLFLFALGGGYLGLNSLNEPHTSADMSLLRQPSPDAFDAAMGAGMGVGASDDFSSGSMAALAGVGNFNFVVATAALLSASGVCCAALLTHGLGGRMRYRHLAWMFWQPFVGGLRFVLMQAMAWTLFSLSLLIFSSVAAVAAFVGHTTLGYGLLASAGAAGLASEFLLMGSLLTFECPKVPCATEPATDSVGGVGADQSGRIGSARAEGGTLTGARGDWESQGESRRVKGRRPTASPAAVVEGTATDDAAEGMGTDVTTADSDDDSRIAAARLPASSAAAAAAAAIAPSVAVAAGSSGAASLSPPCVTELACSAGGAVEGRVGGVAWRAVAVRPQPWTARQLFVATRGVKDVAEAAVAIGRGAVARVRGVKGFEGLNEVKGCRGAEERVKGGPVGVVSRGDWEEGRPLLEEGEEGEAGRVASSSGTSSRGPSFSRSSSTGSINGSSSVSTDISSSSSSSETSDATSSSGVKEQPLSVSEIVWWLAVKARSSVFLTGLYCWQYYVATATLVPILLLSLLPSHLCSTGQQQNDCSFGFGFGYGFGCGYDAVVCALRTASAAVLAGMAWCFAYCLVHPGGYERNGRGECKWIQSIVMPLLEEAAAAYFHGISVVREGPWRQEEGSDLGNGSRWQGEQQAQGGAGGEEEGSGGEMVGGLDNGLAAASSARPLVFAYHPHGLMPAVMAWFPLSSAWRALFPAIRPIPLVASVCFRIPLARTYCLWGGLREVSRKGFLAALEDQRSVVLCPGGQSELTYHATNQSSSIALCARKIGFVRIALQANALLVPTLSFGEPHSFDNLFHWPSLQRFTYRRFGFPIPFWPVGLFGCLPLPRARPMSLVVGRPIDPRSVIPTNFDEPSHEDLCTIRDYYYGEVKALFDRHKAIHGYSHLTLELRK